MGRKIRMIEEKDIPSGTGTDNVDFALYKDGFVESFTFNGKSINILLKLTPKDTKKKAEYKLWDGGEAATEQEAQKSAIEWNSEIRAAVKKAKNDAASAKK